MIPYNEVRLNTIYSFKNVPDNLRTTIKVNLFEIQEYWEGGPYAECIIYLYNNKLQKLKTSKFTRIPIKIKNGIKCMDIIPGKRPIDFKPMKLKDFLRE